ncbi:flagellar assembly protein FliH [Paenibacillus sp. HJL G12]|uniref:Flagellar assembly protein FliH n=1 Tax=Paenibacillus dendrobii TaxID=2691084 RepID=A0A7X3LFE3_9BACL|nr:FliH/SctL family protein [Paenibacillus dendrobii]MWV43551.1 flagellar assembly protein FliH [Paenibacillus dendrobii]
MSNLIKSSQYVPLEALKKLDLGHRYVSSDENVFFEDRTMEETKEIQADEESKRLSKEMLEDAREFAERQLREASDEAERILAEANEQIDGWWQDRRLQDEHLVEALQSEGYDTGYREGSEKALADLQEQISRMMDEAQTVLKQAYLMKEQIVQEAEPFLVDLSCAIAEKVIDKQLTVESDYVIDLIKSNLSRKREQGVITLCVAPKHFAFVQAAREELGAAIDSQAELQILPDSTVHDRGCVIRSSFGSVDARIDTQLTEIKKELIRIALDDEERRDQDEDA